MNQPGLEGWRRLLLLTAAIGLTAAAARADAGYLATVGPVPLRFQAVVAPAIRMPVPPAPPGTNANMASVPPPVTTPSPESLAQPDAVPGQDTTVSNQPAGATEPPSTEPVVSPQMLLRFFNRSTNGVSSGVIAPMDFQPPRASDRPSSKATYSTTP